MTRPSTLPSTLPSTREQAQHALLLLGVPTPARLLVDVHTALLDGDLSVPALATLLRAEERSAFERGAEDRAGLGGVRRAEDRGARAGATSGRPSLVCPGLTPDLTAARSVITLSVWDVADRIRTPAAARADALAATVRIAELVAMRPGACATVLLRQLAADVPGGLESFDPLNPSALATAARAALDDPALAAAVTAEQPLRDAAVARAATLDEHQRLFGVPSVPHQRGRA